VAALTQTNHLHSLTGVGVPDLITDAVLAGIATISADAIICINESQRITFFNEGAERIFGYRSDEIIGQPIETLIPARFRETHSSHVRNFGQSAAKARRMGERNEISGVRKNGEEFPAEAAISRLEKHGKEIYSILLRDITVRRRAEQSQRFLAEASERLSSSLGVEDTMRSLAQLAVPVLGDASIVTAYHDGAFHGLAIAHVDPMQASLLRLRREEVQLEAYGSRPVAEVIRTGKPLFIPDVSAADGRLAAFVRDAGQIFSDRPIAAALCLPLIARGQLLGVIELYTRERHLDAADMTLAEDMSRHAALALDNARLYEQVMLGSRARDDIIGIVSHDLRNPVNAVKMLTGAILGAARDIALPPDVVEYSAIIRQASEQMDSLIRDLLDVTRVEAGRMNVEASATDLEDLLTDALLTLDPVARAKQIALRLTTEQSLPLVEADRERIRQALSNLIGNSVKFSPPGSTIVLRAARVDGEVVVSVKDQGPGMTSEQLSHAFDRFWQSRRTDREGAGLGLTITRGIIEAHGGRIWAESDTGKGSTFHFTLPLAAATTADAEENP
jgi:PAS domain S-box-containing protein